jgi:hypothetical protein
MRYVEKIREAADKMGDLTALGMLLEIGSRYLNILRIFTSVNSQQT